MSERNIQIVAAVTYVGCLALSCYVQYAISKKACKDALKECADVTETTEDAE